MKKSTAVTTTTTTDVTESTFHQNQETGVTILQLPVGNEESRQCLMVFQGGHEDNDTSKSYYSASEQYQAWLSYWATSSYGFKDGMANEENYSRQNMRAYMVLSSDGKMTICVTYERAPKKDK